MWLAHDTLMEDESLKLVGHPRQRRHTGAEAEGSLYKTAEGSLYKTAEGSYRPEGGEVHESIRRRGSTAGSELEGR